MLCRSCGKKAVLDKLNKVEFREFKKGKHEIFIMPYYEKSYESGFTCLTKNHKQECPICECLKRLNMKSTEEIT